MINSPIKINNLKFKNRVVLQPMEGCDCNLDGSPHNLTVQKYINNANNGAGLIWFEANAVCMEGRTNSRQMMITSRNLIKFKTLIAQVKLSSKEKFGFEPVCVLQLTHSGRQSIVPMIAYRNEVYEKDRPATDSNIITDEYLDELPKYYLDSAKLAIEAGFDGIDVKSCHGYLLQEILSGFNRPGKYGGSFENRTKLYLSIIKLLKDNLPSNFLITTRLGITDMVKKPYGFGTTCENKIDLYEPIKLIKLLEKQGINLINITLGNPYFNPHVNRPYKKGAYIPDESPDTGLKRFAEVGKILKKTFPNIAFINSALSYYRHNMFQKAEKLLQSNCADFIGFGRVTLAYPNFYIDYLNNKFDGKKCCMACSRCTQLMRAQQVSGCAIFNKYYKELYKKEVLCQKK